MSGWKGSSYNDTTSGFHQTWKLWRHCCCRYGWYPLVVAPIVTIGCLLSLYCSSGCKFIEVDVGFEPSNQAWNQSEAYLGLFYLYKGESSGKGLADLVQGGCERYTSDFEDEFLNGDRTWRVARIMSVISGIASLTASLTAWLFVLSPLPASFFWPGVLLPAQMVAFLSEGSKFLIFDTAICRTALWFPGGEESLPQSAQSCSMGDTGYIAVAAGIVHFVGLMFVCLKAPGKRELDDSFGRPYAPEGDDDMENPTVSDQGQFRSTAPEVVFPQGTDVFIVGNESIQDPADVTSMYDTEIVSVDRHKSHHHQAAGGSSASGDTYSIDGRDASGIKYSIDGRDASGSKYSIDGRDASGIKYCIDGREPSGIKSHSEESRDDISEALAAESGEASRFDQKKSAAEIAMGNNMLKGIGSDIGKGGDRISESRVKKIEKMELNSTTESEDLIERFVSDLNLSFQSTDSRR